MTTPSDLHVYDREIDSNERTSLSVLSAQIPAGARVLDLGCGSGAIGRFLARRGDGARIDGLTLNEQEAALAAPHYGQVRVANLDSADLTALFAPGSYDVIVCADVLEHTRHPEQVLAACRRLLAEGGRVLISIPNAGYCGLIAELMAGEFRYRPEGLLDETHLRFFTRQALTRFLHEGRWAIEHLDTIERALPDSEFRTAFDALPAPVARHLLALPDALTYQFIVCARPAAEGEALPPAPAAPLLPAQALFVSELYIGQPEGGFAENAKVRASGVMGQASQSLRFALPAHAAPTALKLDPADRPGFFYLHELRLLNAQGDELWQWDGRNPEALLRAPHSGMALQAPATPQGAFTALLLDDDPWLELPIPAQALAQAAGGALHVQAGWPMSADWMALAGPAQREIAQARERTEAAYKTLTDERAQWQTQWQAQQQHVRQIESRDLALQRQVQALELQNANLRQQGKTLHERASQLASERDEVRRLLIDIENSTVFRATRPIVHAKMRIDRLLGAGSARPAPAHIPAPLTPPEQPVDLIVPVYRGLPDTRRCLESALASACRTPWRLIVINDASPEPELTEWLRDLAAREPRITLLENEENLGFVATVNRGMALSAENDVLLLNSDTEVAGNWLDRLRAAAYSDQRIASVTPFSNNATICSYPGFCQDNDLPHGYDTAGLDALFARANAGQVIDVPTGVGFCMYIRRAALQAVGLFDVENFGKGYGEENDFCIRAENAGWRNLHALDTFVRHFGGVSFGAAKSPREQAAMQTLRRLHPRYEAAVHRFVQADPARAARLAVDVARTLAPNPQGRPRPVILAVLHDRQGGTERHVSELARLLHEQAQFLVLRPLPGQRVSLRLPDEQDRLELVFDLRSEYPLLLKTLRQFGVCHIHYHHLLGHGEEILALPERLGLGYDFTAHDFFIICPDITLTDARGRYCGEDGPEGSDRAALAAWRQQFVAFANGARYLIGPGRDVLARLAPYLPGAALRHIPHPDLDGIARPAPHPRPLQGGRPLKVAVIGALSVIKGADVLEDTARAARKQNIPVEFHLIGYGYRTLRTQPHTRLTVHGRYADQDLPELLQWLQPDLVWFPAQWPETYSYTLSACLQGGWPVVAPDLGAFAERLQGRPWSWVRPWNQTPAQWLEFFADIRQRHYLTGQAPEPCPGQPEPAAGSAKPVVHLPAPPASARQWYQSDYLAHLPTPPTPTSETDAPQTGPDLALLLAHQTHPSASAPGPRSKTLRLLAWLRSLPLLAPLTRAIPAHWQTRVKSWLAK